MTGILLIGRNTISESPKESDREHAQSSLVVATPACIDESAYETTRAQRGLFFVSCGGFLE